MSSEIPLILALDVAGSPNRWITYQEAAYYYAKDLVAWSMGDDDYTIWGGHRPEGLRSSLTMSSIIAVRGQPQAKVNGNRVPNLTNRALFRRDHNVCAYCGTEFKAVELTCDHVTPRSIGGENRWTNTVTACGSCNRRKGARTPEEANMHLMYVPYTPDRAEWLILMNRKIRYDQMEFLKKQITNKESRILN